ncbi:PilW family protein [Paenibacillus dakarensis]|uniref:PilW family protein n=1 Tax=Paenibacillus dakarensis TaxID=1527293 RepID=UPI0006D55A82|nr:prepilin-type N-terminal cleavage/methylation domain-containing protein [Paenibacillus dakarensis]
MKKFANRFRSESGFTLVELIAALMIFSLVVILISSVTIFGFKNYNKISMENSLREEADIVMSSIMTELYSFGPEYIENIEAAGSGMSGIVLIRGEGKETVRRSIKILDGRLVIGDVGAPPAENDPRTAADFDLSGSTIQSKTADGRFCEGERFCSSGLIDISLQLQQQGSDGSLYELALESKFGF